jgi:hypothetical protein
MGTHPKSDFKCEYGVCRHGVVYELLWESCDDQGYPVEPPDNANCRYSCGCLRHLVGLVRNHPWGPSVDDIMLAGGRGESVSWLRDRVNKLAMKRDGK